MTMRIDSEELSRTGSLAPASLSSVSGLGKYTFRFISSPITLDYWFWWCHPIASTGDREGTTWLNLTRSPPKHLDDASCLRWAISTGTATFEISHVSVARN